MEFGAEFKFAKIPSSHVVGGGDSHNLMLSSNLLKSKIPMLRVGGDLQNLMLSSNLLKSQNSHIEGGGGGDGELMVFDAESKFAKKTNFLRKIF